MPTSRRRQFLAGIGTAVVAASGCLRLTSGQASPTAAPGESSPAPTDDATQSTAANGGTRRTIREAFDEGLNRWEIGLHPPAGDQVTEGDGEWTDEYGGSVHLHVDGGPDHVGVYRPFDGLSRGTVVVASYESPNLEGEPGGPRLRVHRSDDHKGQIDMDDGGENPDGTLVGTVPESMPNGATVEFRLGVWPGEIDVYVREIQILVPE